jgi:CRISPR system Cascade subunit CasB
MTQRPYEQEASGALQWHSSLTPREFNGRHIPGDRAALARLRRASSIMEAAVEPATADLYARLGFARQTAERDLPRAALVAAVLAHVRANTGAPIAAAIGTPRGGADSQQKITPLRFKRLVAARTPDELLIAFRRVVAILGDQANVRDLARQLLAFTDPDERQADIARTRFAFAYHGAADFAPGAEPNSETANIAED